MKCWLWLCVVAVFGLASSLEAGETKTRVLLVGKNNDHPYGTHEYMIECKLLAKCLEQTKGVETVVSNGWPKDEALLKDIKAIVLYTAKGGNVILAPAVRDQCLKLLKSGVGLTALHWSTGADQLQGDEYLHLLGGWFSQEYAGSKLNTTKTTLLQTDPKHPICFGWKPYELRDEYYLDLKFLPEARPVLSVHIKDKDYTVGWAYERPKHNGGRSFGFVCGHFHDNFGEKDFRKAIINGVLWTAHLDVPPEGAPVDITAKDMELPPKKNSK
jgi:type 1 glutamine amidotransferase